MARPAPIRSTVSGSDGGARDQAIVSLVWKNPDRVLDVVARLRGTKDNIECRLRGGSMESAIPRGSTLRIGLRARVPLRVGEVVAFAEESGVCIHRVVYRGRGPRAKGYVVTQGDACLCPDPPVGEDRVLGPVTAFQQRDVWAAPGAPPPSARARSLASRVLQLAISALMEVDVQLGRFAAMLATSVGNQLPIISPVGGVALKLRRRSARARVRH